jgi:uncharacterized membrane protein YjgN (DUF898 family)
MADVAATQVSSQTSNQKHTPVIFEGKTSEYFGIWIVNLLLSIVTLGIYSAWAKVRRKKYFYNNTLIDNVGFDYHAKPISILKGRLIAVALLVAAINPILQSLVFLVIFIFLPWLVVRGSIFNARNTSHRGLRFDFVGTVGQAVRVFIGLPLLTMITLGLAAPYAAHEKNQFLVNNHRFGLSQFDMKRVVKEFYKVYLILIVVPLIGILAAIAIPAYQSYVNKAKATSQAEPSQSQLMLPSNIAAFAPIDQHKMLLAANDVEVAAPADAEVKMIERVYSDANPPAELAAEPATELTAQQAVDPAANPATSMPTAEQVEEQLEQFEGEMQEKLSEEDLQKIQEQMEQMGAAEEQNLSEMQQMMEWLKNPSMILAMLAGAAAYLLFIFGFIGYLQARIGNLIWNNTTLDKLSFKSTLRARDFALLYFTNIVAIMLTFGLATPWAQIRMARYRASKLQIVGDVDFDQFVGDKKAEVKATGEEIAEMFDVDLSFG